ncbi:hypothetical protein ABTZ03_17360 [Kitasatospora sp. NPDC096077]|uniref:hypothetical protein n=1 Tax=Kitasatospora sp. NPDC096077 TaxID=3155544 RepID=UPI0033186CB5
MGEGYQADPEALELVADGLNGVIAELKSIGVAGIAEGGRGFTELELGGTDAGDFDLSESFKEFCERWSWAVRSLVVKGSDLANKVGLAAGTYHEQEQYASGLTKDVVSGVIGNPHLTEEQVEHESWSQVWADNPVNDVMHPDYSGESFDKAEADIKQQWQKAAQDAVQKPGFVNMTINATVGPVPSTPEK